MRRALLLIGLAPLWLNASPATAATGLRLLSGFEDPNDHWRWSIRGARVERVRQHATEGRYALRLTLVSPDYPGLALERGSPLLRGWREFDFLRIDIFNPQPHPVSIGVRIDDIYSVNYGSRYNEQFTLRPGPNTLELPLQRLETSDKKRTLALGQLRLLMLFGVGITQPVELFFDNIRLEQSPATPTARDVRTFDFGPASSPVARTFTRVTAADTYTRQRGYGWTSTNQLFEFDNELPDALCRDFISGNPQEDFVTSFAVDLPNGIYTVVVCGHSLLSQTAHFPARTYWLAAEAVERLRIPVNAENFYTEQFLFRGIHNDWWPEKDVWTDEILPKFPEHSFEVDLADGQLNLDFHNMAVFWLAIYPSARAAEANKWLQAVRADRRREFYEKTFYLQPYRAEPNPEKIRLSLARGQTVSAFFNAKNPPALKWETEPTGLAAELRAVRLMERPVARGIYRIEPMTIVPLANRPHAQRFCLSLRADTNAPPGVYRGEVAGLPVEVRVWPFALPAAAELPVSFGWFYGDPAEENYYFSRFPEKSAQRLAIRQRELRDMAEHGFNSIVMRGPAPRVGAEITLHTAPEDEFLAACRSAGLLGRQPVMMSTLRIAQVLSGVLNVREFSPEFLAPFRAALRALGDWTRRNNYPVVFLVVDEPREQALNPWNRNFEDTKRFLELYRAAGLRTVVTLSADSSHGKSYVPLVALMDIAATHPWPASKGIIEAAQAGNTELWLYNGGMDRLGWGFHPWALGATGRFEWHYQWWTQAYDPFARGPEDPWQPGLGAVMPSPDGPVPTVAYEQVRAGIDDYRYVALLERLIREKPGRAAAAKRFLEQIRGEIPRFPKGGTVKLDDATLDAWRERIAGFIVELSAEAAK